MQKIQVTLDATKLRDLVSKRSYTNRNGQNVELKEVKFDLVELKDDKKKVVWTNAQQTMQLEKTHFAVVQQTKEEREAKKDPVFIGDGISVVFLDNSDDDLGF